MWNNKALHICNLHPLTIFLYYMLLFGLLVFMGNPYLYFSVFISSFILSIYFEGIDAINYLKKLSVIALLFVIINPLFSHEGMTIINYFPNGNAFTLESIYFGLGMAVLFLATMFMFKVFSNSMNPDRWVELFGNISPDFSLMISMIFRFINRFKDTYKKIKLVNKDKSVFSCFSMLISYALESSIDTADSMAARGYSLTKRSHLKRHKLRLMDIAVILISIAFLGILIYCNKMNYFNFYYYPKLTLICNDITKYLLPILYIFYSMIPLIYQITEDIKWKFLRSII
ncbi:MAG: energy-coupling factor transporter transmembrane protein EcfT [Lachnospiraceae bacterium]|nr:energy-coupling factor transporter transmembrane protein EcfT [Lachnospiraceae bacterium]